MKTKEIFLNILIALSVVAASLFIASTLIDSERQKYEQLKNK